MNVFIEVFNNLVGSSIKQITELATGFGPKILFALLVITLGWIFALLARKIISKLLKAFGFDVFTEKFGLKKILQKGGIERTPSSMVSLIFYWLILLNSFIMASNVMNIGFTVDIMRLTLIYIPKIAVFVIIIALGVMAGKFIDNFIYRASKAANIPFSSLAAKAAGYITFVFSLIIALDYMNLPRSISLQLSIVMVIVIPFFLFILFFTGGREVISNLTASRFIKKEYKEGDIVAAETFDGEIISTGIFAVVLRRKSEEIIIPNSIFVQLIVRREISKKKE